MKVLLLTVKNVGLIEDAAIPFNSPLLVFYGQVRAGKSTILNAVRWVLGGAWPQDIIRHGAEEATIVLGLDNGSVTRCWYRGRDGETKARDIVFVQDGKPVKRPAAEIAKLLNPFVRNQDYLRSMSEPERKAYFAQLLQVNTSELDAEAAAASGQAVELRAQIKAYGEFEPTILIPPASPPDVEGLIAESDMIRAEYDEVMSFWRASEIERNSIEVERQQRKRAVDDLHARISEMQNKIVEAKSKIEQIEQWHAHFPVRAAQPEPAKPDRLGQIEQELRDAGARKANYEAWQKDVGRYNQKQAAEAKLTKLEKRQREIKDQKASLLKDHAATCGVPGLAFDESGQVVFEETTAGMLSTSQLMRLSAALASLYPPGFGLELIDRAESLGKSIYDLIDYAQKRERTILATVVGEAPAQSPPEVGVFVVEAGKVEPK